MSESPLLKSKIQFFRQKGKEKKNEKDPACKGSERSTNIPSSVSEMGSGLSEETKTPPIKSLMRLLKKTSMENKTSGPTSRQPLCPEHWTPSRLKSTSISGCSGENLSDMKIHDTKDEDASGTTETRNKVLTQDFYAFNEKIFQLTLKKIDRMKVDRSYQSEYRYAVLKHIYEQTLLRRVYYTKILEEEYNREQELGRRHHTSRHFR
ncbi:hypothetical protein MDAP_000509 [Mitosporidium daphniae]|uniref:Uncharacterized protein n=1 Tax=Mitosporidium daphniae TaxID=1485682 RepID=A0A098VRE8_9MICR|nr:uncharacterized protein DI09_30p230 [Mitosporidium daphniae]KGG51607.1 hypothetical protein DI09_30p230 [Mitosporidium daphniae]|eukprot:XP_013238034.1 uncharacterized protein DI09_30p230 [Mitosporidium daphniae]